MGYLLYTGKTRNWIPGKTKLIGPPAPTPNLTLYDDNDRDNEENDKPDGHRYHQAG